MAFSPSGSGTRVLLQAVGLNANKDQSFTAEPDSLWARPTGEVGKGEAAAGLFGFQWFAGDF